MRGRFLHRKTEIISANPTHDRLAKIAHLGTIHAHDWLERDTRVFNLECATIAFLDKLVEILLLLRFFYWWICLRRFLSTKSLLVNGKPATHNSLTRKQSCDDSEMLASYDLTNPLTVTENG